MTDITIIHQDEHNIDLDITGDTLEVMKDIARKALIAANDTHGAYILLLGATKLIAMMLEEDNA